MDHQNSIALIVPIYNQEKYLSRCIESIVSQNIENIKIILVDDGSTDSSLQICNQYASIYPDHIEVIHKENGGLSSARNAGITMSKTDYVTFVDPDDYVEPGYLDVVRSFIKENQSEKALFVFSYQIKYVDCEPTKIILKDQAIDTKSGICYLEEKGAFNLCWNKVYCRCVLEKNGILFELNSEPGEDLLFNCKYFKTIENVVISDKVLYNYMRNGEDSLANKFRPNLWEKSKNFISAIEKLFLFYHLEAENQQKILAEACIEYIHANIPNMYRKKHPFSKKQRIAFYREILDNKTFAYYFSILDSKSKLLNQLKKQYLKHSAAKMDLHYSFFMFIRNHFFGLYRFVRKKLIK